MSKKFQLVMNDRFWTLLNDLRVRTGAETNTEVVKEALMTLDWIQKQREDGKEVVAQPRKDEQIVPFGAYPGTVERTRRMR